MPLDGTYTYKSLGGLHFVEDKPTNYFALLHIRNKIQFIVQACMWAGGRYSDFKLVEC